MKLEMREEESDDDDDDDDDDDGTAQAQAVAPLPKPSRTGQPPSLRAMPEDKSCPKDGKMTCFCVQWQIFRQF